jgi:hypothetical protein
MHGATITMVKQTLCVPFPHSYQNPLSLRPNLRFRASAMLLLRATGNLSRVVLGGLRWHNKFRSYV